jgi:DNA modification methylase
MNLIDNNAFDKLIKSKKLDEHKDEIVSQLNELIDKYLADKTRELKSKKRLIDIDKKKEHAPANEALSKQVIASLPSWVQKDIDNAVVIGTSGQVVQTSNGKKYHIGNKLNDLPGAEWTFFLNSVINTRFSTNGPEGFAHHIRKIHPSPKPPQLMQQIIEFFTKEHEWVLDYFMGVGGSLLGASMCNRKAVGVDLSPIYIDAYKQASNYLGLKEQVTFNADSVSLLKNPEPLLEGLSGEQFSLILIDPPYGDMMARPKTGEAIKKGGDTSATPFTDLEEDLGNMSWPKFLQVFNKTVVSALKLVKHKGHLVIFLKDLQPKGKELNLLHADLIYNLNDIEGLKYLGTKIWADQSVNLYPYGYPYSYVSNQIHQYIIIFRKD